MWEQSFSLIDNGYSMKFDIQLMIMTHVQIREMMYHLVLEVFIGNDDLLRLSFHVYIFHDLTEDK